MTFNCLGNNTVRQMQYALRTTQEASDSTIVQ